MKDKLKKILLIKINVPLLLVACFASILLWLIVVNVDDPTRTKTFTTTVTVKNEQILEKQGKYYSLKGDNKISFRVTGKRSIIEKLTASDFTAVADMNNLEDNKRIPVYITADKYANSVTISSKTYYLDVNVGEVNENEFDIICDATGQLGEGYGVNSMTSDPESVVITGPDYVVKTITQVKAIVDVTNLTENASKTVSLQPYDKNGNLVDTSMLRFNHKKVNVSVEIGLVKDIEVKLDTSGSLPSGLELVSITVNPTTIKVIGTANTLNSVTSVVIPASVINLSNVTDTVTTTVSLNSYLPAGVKVLSGDDTTASINIVVKKSSATGGATKNEDEN